MIPVYKIHFEIEYEVEITLKILLNIKCGDKIEVYLT